MELFRTDNTEDYTDTELDALNKEWQARVEYLDLEEYTDEYNVQAKAFCDDVAKR